MSTLTTARISPARVLMALVLGMLLAFQPALVFAGTGATPCATDGVDADCCCAEPVVEVAADEGCCSEEGPAPAPRPDDEDCDCRLVPVQPDELPAPLAQWQSSSSDAFGRWLTLHAERSAQLLAVVLVPDGHAPLRKAAGMPLPARASSSPPRVTGTIRHLAELSVARI
jgi:hypothetical protein